VRELVLTEAGAATGGEQNGAQRCVCNHDASDYSGLADLLTAP
jgi:hypothetical protein